MMVVGDAGNPSGWDLSWLLKKKKATITLFGIKVVL